MSLIHNNLGINQSPEQINDKKAEGNAELMMSVRDSSMDKLSEETLFSWHTILMKGSRGIKTAHQSNEITPWISYFINMVFNSQIQTEEQIEFTLKKSKFFELYEKRLNDRQLRVVRRMFENGINGFEGGMSARKYISITKTSKATATRDLQNLAEIGAFTPIGGGGRSTRYALAL